MGGCLCTKKSGTDRFLILDVQPILADYVWDEFLVSSSRCRSLFMRRKDYTIEVPMNYYHFDEIQEEDPRNALQIVGNAASKSTTPSTSLLKDKQLAHQDKTSPQNNHLETKFRNDTDKDQTFSFRYEKVRHGTISVTYQKGFSFGGKASFTVDLAKVPGVDIEARYEVTKETGETFEETLTTETTSDIIVSSHSTCTASVVMEERHLQARFNVRVKMWMPEGRAMVFVKNKRGERVFTKEIVNLSFLFDPEYHYMVKDEQGGEVPAPDAVVFQVNGIVEGTLLSHHKIRLKSRKLRDTESNEVDDIAIEDADDDSSKLFKRNSRANRRDQME